MYSVVITAAGSGTRAKLGYNKMLFEINGETLIEKTVRIFASNASFNDIIVTASQADIAEYQKILKNYQVKIVVGGSERMHSVSMGVEAADNNVVFVHDGARIFLDDELISRLTDFKSDYDGLSLALGVTDTILQVENGRINNILDRNTLYNMQTPQVVKKAIYKKCYQKAIEDQVVYTDEMSMLTAYKYNCQIVESESYNIKMTKPEDFRR